MENYFKQDLGQDIYLLYPDISMASEVFALINSDRHHLRSYLDFIDATQKVSDEENYIKSKLQGIAANTDRLYFLAYQDKIVGCIDLHCINWQTQSAEIGYWLHSSVTGQGLMTVAVNHLVNLAFKQMGLNRLEIHAAVDNLPSNALAKRCDFRLEGCARSSRLLYGQLIDMNHYAILKSDR
ncbi:GNAT family N-acetyltransferase [Aerococcus kribbianus]|uniref:GNAT family protein n=1 Tax=Aerococcus kribbianus TaxID=2999064 RepID=A0A9X3JFL9_9LACT|nr:MULTISPECIES: GNAT family protein [unclassified Aerococcus]MCZ0717799.1 GNAT family protein [Aerococcus sp. YH-aer221]MCZ0726086.1 GNAT family protein [Aerococcus sp. YH-aer222]